MRQPAFRRACQRGPEDHRPLPTRTHRRRAAPGLRPSQDDPGQLRALVDGAAHARRWGSKCMPGMDSSANVGQWRPFQIEELHIDPRSSVVRCSSASRKRCTAPRCRTPHDRVLLRDLRHHRFHRSTDDRSSRRSSRLSQFFILEAGDYVEQLDGVLLASRGAGEMPTPCNAWRALRGTATMARFPRSPRRGSARGTPLRKARSPGTPD